MQNKTSRRYKFVCPICQHVDYRISARYMGVLVCQSCGQKASSPDGRLVTYYNGYRKEVTSQGVIHRPIGVVGEYQDTKEPYKSSVFYVDGIACYAREAHFGGVVYLIGEE